MTLPWSIFSFVFMVGGLHSGDELGALAIFTVKALLNAYLIWLFFDYRRKKRLAN
jgi:hypothetical protein